MAYSKNGYMYADEGAATQLTVLGGILRGCHGFDIQGCQKRSLQGKNVVPCINQSTYVKVDFKARFEVAKLGVSLEVMKAYLLKLRAL